MKKSEAIARLEEVYSALIQNDLIFAAGEIAAAIRIVKQITEVDDDKAELVEKLSNVIKECCELSGLELVEELDEPEWSAMLYAPTDGTEIELLLHHSNRRFAKDDEKAKWESIVTSKWIDHNNGGWTWSGLCGVPMGWRPVK